MSWSKSFFTEDQYFILKKNWKDYTSPELAKLLNVKLWRIRHAAHELGLKKQINRYWTKEEIEILVSNYKTKGDKEIGLILGRTLKMVEKKRYHLKIKRTKDQIFKIRGRNSIVFSHGFQKGNIPPMLREEGEIYERPKENYLYTKHKGRIRRLSHVVWEKHNDKIPKGFFIWHKDQNRKNVSIENLEIIDNIELIKRNSIINLSPELHSTIMKLSHFNKRIKKLEKCLETK